MDAQVLKDQGNDKYKAGQYEQAVQLYTEAIKLDASNATLYSNRSLSQLLLGKHQEALSDAQQTCKLKPDWEKGHFRCGAALEAMGDLAQALPAYQRALDLNPMSEEIIKKVRELKKQVSVQQAHSEQLAPGVTMHRVPPGGARMPTPAGWAAGLSSDKQAEWLVDCYRMRLDDDYAWGGGNLHGLYHVSTNPDVSPSEAKATICEDFLIFCKLAKQHGVIPQGWDWARFLKTAAGLLPYAFEKSDAQEKWGGENVFMAAVGGRSLRYTAEVVYGMSAMAMGGLGFGGGGGEDEGTAFDEVTAQVEGKWRQLVRGGEAFESVGGVAAWKQLHSALRLHPSVF